MYKIYFVNFGYFSSNEGKTLFDARQIAKNAGFEARIDDPDGNPVATWSPLYGYKEYTTSSKDSADFSY